MSNKLLEKFLFTEIQQSIDQPINVNVLLNDRVKSKRNKKHKSLNLKTKREEINMRMLKTLERVEYDRSEIAHQKIKILD